MSKTSESNKNYSQGTKSTKSIKKYQKVEAENIQAINRVCRCEAMNKYGWWFIWSCAHISEWETVLGGYTINLKSKYLHYSITPLTSGAGNEGTRFPNIAALPLCRRIPRRPHRWWTASPSSWPVCLARAAPSFLTSLSAAPCHPPKDSTAIGMKAIPWRRQSSSAPLIFRL